MVRANRKQVNLSDIEGNLSDILANWSTIQANWVVPYTQVSLNRT